MKRDLKINYGVLDEICSSLEAYRSQCSEMRNSVALINRLIEDSEGKSIESLKKTYQSTLDALDAYKERINDVNTLISTYSSEMCQEIQPLGRGGFTRVDNNSTFWGIYLIDVAVPRYYSYGSSEDDDSWKIAELDAIADAFKNRVIAARDQLYELHEKASRYEQTDNDLATAADALYSKYTDETDKILDSWGWFFGGIGSLLYGVLVGIADILVGLSALVGLFVLSPIYIYSNPIGLCPEEIKVFVEGGWGGIAGFFTNFPGSVESLFVQFTDDFDEDPVYAIGKLIPDIAGIFLGAKGIDKLARLSRATKVADSIGDAGVVGSRWINPDGSVKWPPNNGAVIGTEETISLQPGNTIGRYGNSTGRYTAPSGTPAEQLSLSPGTDTAMYKEYIIIKEIPDVEKATIAPWFDQPGGGTQFKLPQTIDELLQGGYIEEVS